MALTPEQQRRRLDPVAVDAALRRLARRQPTAPWLHQEVARRMADKLPLIRARPERVIDWWSTLGGSAALLRAAYPKARQVAVEPDADWLRITREHQRRPWWSAGRWAQGEASAVLDGGPLEPGAGLLWANMMLHAVVDPAALIARWHGLVATDGFVMFSCLGPGTMRELRAVYERLGWPAPTPGFVDMHDLGDMLVRAGFADPVMDQETLTLRWPDAPSLLTELRTLGGNAAPDRCPGLRTPRWRRRLEAALEATAGSDGSIGLGFEVAYGHAFKGGPRIRPGEPATVALDDMRAQLRRSRPPS